MKIKCFEKWSKFQHGNGYWLGAVQATSHCLNQCWHSSSTHTRQSAWLNRVLSSIMPLYDQSRNGYVVEVAAWVVTGSAEACLQRLRWRLGRSSWQRIRVIDEITMHSYLSYRPTVFKHTGAETRWLPFCRRHFKMHFLESKLLNSK